MRIADLPKYVETAHFTVWRNTWAYRKLSYPYVGFYIKRGDDVFELWARPNTDLEPFLEKISDLGVETAEALAYMIVKYGMKGLFRSTYILRSDDMLITLDTVEGGILNFVFYHNGKELMLSLPRDASLVWLIAVIKSLAEKKKEREGHG